MRKLFLLLVILLLTACETETPSVELVIQPVTPVATLPALPTRGAATIKSYADASAQATEVKALIADAGGLLDVAADGGTFDCERYFDLYQTGAALPVLTAAKSDDALLVWAAAEYNEAIAGLLDAGGDTYRHCEAFLLGKATQSEVSALAWTYARFGVTEAIANLDAIITRMRDELPDPTTYVGVGGQVLKATREAIDVMGDMGYEFDKRVVVCPTFIEKYEQMTALPEITIVTADATVQAAYEKYRWAVAEATRTSRDQYLDCKDIMAIGKGRYIPELTWETARKGLNDAMAALHQAEEWLQPYGK